MLKIQTMPRAARVAAAGLGMLWAASAAAQTVFFDDFDGNALKPHWTTPPPHHWDYEIRDSKLFVNQLFFPSDPNDPWNSAGIGANLPVHLGDFDLHARMGWEEEWEFDLGVAIRDPNGQQIATMRGGTGLVTASTRTGPIQTFGNPGPGLHDFLIRRRGTDVEFLLNEVLLTTIPDFGNPAARVLFFFLEPYPQPPGQRPVFIDSIRVVPAPGAAAVFLAGGFVVFSRRRSS